MKTLITFGLFMLVTFTFAQSSKNFIDQPYIEVNGKSEMEVTPDEIYLKILIDEKDSKGKLTLEQQEREMIGKLKQLQINVDEQLSVKDFASNFKNYIFKKTDIQTSKEYQLLLHDGLTVARVFMDLESVGISNISIEKVDHSQLEKFKQQVKIDAIKAGKEKAEQLAGAIGQNIGKAIYIQEIEMGNPRMFLGKMAGVSFRESYSFETDDLPQIEFEKIPVEYTVHILFELK